MRYVLLILRVNNFKFSNNLSPLERTLYNIKLNNRIFIVMISILININRDF